MLSSARELRIAPFQVSGLAFGRRATPQQRLLVLVRARGSLTFFFWHDMQNILNFVLIDLESGKSAEVAVNLLDIVVSSGKHTLVHLWCY